MDVRTRQLKALPSFGTERKEEMELRGEECSPCNSAMSHFLHLLRKGFPEPASEVCP